VRVFAGKGFMDVMAVQQLLDDGRAASRDISKAGREILCS
jgi:hypothetical protein